MMRLKKSITSLLCLVMLWHSGGYAFAATLKESLKEEDVVAQKYVSTDSLYTQMFPSEPSSTMPTITMSQTDDFIDINLGNNMFPTLVVPEAIRSMTSGDGRTTRNDTGAAISGISAVNTVPNVFDLTDTTPQIWARYYPNGRVGQIEVTYLRKKPYIATGVNTSIPANTVELKTDQLPPSAGSVLTKGNNIKTPYRSVNPFTSFMRANNTLYNDISLTAFTAAVGIWARYYSTQRGYLAVAEQKFYGTYQWEECTMSILGACLRRKNHVEAYATVIPHWSIMTAAENAPLRSTMTGYKVQNCMSAASTLPTDTFFDNRRNTECLAFSGIGFLPATKNSDIPSDETRVWYQHDSQEGWTMLFYILLTAISYGAFSYFTAVAEVTSTELLMEMPLATSSAIAGGMPLASIATPFTYGFEVGYSMVANDILTAAIVDGGIAGSSYLIGSLVINGGNIGSIQNGWMSSVNNGVEVAQGVSNHDWAPNDCIATGSRTPGALIQGPGRYGPEVCLGWLTGDLNSTPGAVGDYFRARRLDLTRDSVTPNDIKNMRDENIRPMVIGGAPIRK